MLGFCSISRHKTTALFLAMSKELTVKVALTFLSLWPVC